MLHSERQQHNSSFFKNVNSLPSFLNNNHECSQVLLRFFHIFLIPCAYVLGRIFRAWPRSHSNGNHVLQTSCMIAAKVTSPGVTKATCAGFNLVILEAAEHGACTPRERPSFSTRKPARG